MDTQQTTSQPASPPQPAMEAPHPVTFDVSYPEKSSRLWALGTLVFLIGKGIAIIPHAIILYVLSFVAMLVALIAQIVVLFAGRYPRGLFDFVVGFYRWQIRVNAFVLGLTDRYPPFTLK